MKRLAWLAALACTAALAASDPAPSDFAWRGTLDTSGRSGLLRVAVPAEALARLQSTNAADLRIFDAQSRTVPFARSTPELPARPQRQQTQPFAALPLFSAEAGGARPGAVQLRIAQDGQQRSVWVQLGATAAEPPSTAQRLPAALFDTRGQRDAVSALVVQARLPANAPVRISVATSPDLAQWTDAPVQGRLYRFEGAGAPANDRLEFPAPLQLRDRYLRLAWTGQPEVVVESVAGLLPSAQPDPAWPALVLGEPHADGASALEWQLGFATPLRKLQIATPQPNTLVPLRILGRNQPSEPWRLLAHTLVYRLGAGAEESSNAAVELPHPSMRWLRLEATHGARLQGVPLAVQVLFDPLELVFGAGDAGPYQLAAGRAETSATALPLGLLAATTSTRIQDLPVARIAHAESRPAPGAGFADWLPRGVDQKTAGLWLVLGLGVLVLGAVAASLLRQLNAPRGDS